MSLLHVLRCDCCLDKSHEVRAGDVPAGWLRRWERGGPDRLVLAPILMDYCPACGESCACTGRCVRADRPAAPPGEPTQAPAASPEPAGSGGG